MRDALHDRVNGLNVEAAGGAHRHAADVFAELLAGGDRRAHEIAGSKPLDRFCAHQIAARKAVLREPRALIAATASAFDLKRRARPGVDRIDLADTGSIERMRFRNSEARAVELREAAAAGLDRQVGHLERLKQCPTGRIDSGRVLERPRP